MVCPWCEHDHPTRADREACEAIHGRVRHYPEEVGPLFAREYLCALCGHVAPYGELLEHFRYHHAHEHAPSGHLVRPIRMMGDV